MTIAVYPGTFDPIHYGHIDIIKRAAELFDSLIVGVYDRPHKSLFFPAEQRTEMVRRAVADVPGVKVLCYSGLTVDFVRSQGASVIVRGLRAIVDFELEYQMALMNRKLAPEVDVVCLMTSQEYAFVSSTIVKEIAIAGGPVTQFVPAHVEEALRARLLAQA
ncbi:MAG: pantetheine-phosphate adenylyltransferase [Chloroflexi bacterium]|nr:pantetheine-phosphate adenylyltransferase [Chloroflexota bacterium]